MNIRDRLRRLLAESSGELPHTAVETRVAEIASSFDAARPDSLVGLTIKDRYKVERELGRGGMGVVYQASDVDVHSRRVVIKVLLANSASDEWLVRKFAHESEALSRIDDPGVVQVIDRGCFSDGTPFFVMEFIRGENLRSYIRRGGLPLKEVGRIVGQVGRALAAAHECNVVHRDLKPENIMMQQLASGSTQAKLIDFGIAKVKNPTSATETLGSMSAGTPFYMAPEQLERGEATPASDVFSLAVITFELLTGELPFVVGGNRLVDLNALLSQHRAGVPKRPREYRSEIPMRADELILRALSYSAWDRALSAGAFAESLSALLALGQPDVETDSDPTLPMPRDGPSPDATDRDSWLHTPTSSVTLSRLAPVGGAVPLDSPLYVLRPTDDEFYSAIARRDSIVLVKGARQMGKTSLLARGAQRARESGARVVVTDFQALDESQFESADRLFFTLAESIADQLDLDTPPSSTWDPKRGAGTNFKRFIQRDVLGSMLTALVWVLDEVDRLFTRSFHSEVFGLFRSWHNARAFEPGASWNRLTLAMAYATEAHLFITDPNQSPFNVGTRLALSDFTFESVEDLNSRYGDPLTSTAEVRRLVDLVGGHPYLVRRSLHHFVMRECSITDFELIADRDDGPLGDHLRQVLALVSHDKELRSAIRALLTGKKSVSAESFYLLRASGIVAGETPVEMHPRCELYSRYLKKHLL